MIVRIVRMVFRPDTVADFEALFSEVRAKIEDQPGCRGVLLASDPTDPLVRYTHSLWRDADALEAYRHGDLFAATWPRTKVLFGDRPQAFSLQLYAPLQMPLQLPR